MTRKPDWPPSASEIDGDRDAKGAPKNPFKLSKRRRQRREESVEDQCQCDGLPDGVPCATCYIAGVKEWPTDAEEN